VLHENPFPVNEQDLIGIIFIGLVEATDVAVEHRYLVKANLTLGGASFPLCRSAL
jgi:hypothetical protein